MRKHYTYLLALMLVCCTGLLSCEEENRRNGDLDKVELEVNIYDGTHLFDNVTEDTDAEFEYAIKTIRVFVFKGNSLESKVGYVEDDNGDEIALIEDPDTQEKYYSATLSLEKGYKTICMIANEPASMTADLDAITNLTALKALLLDADFDTYNKTNPPYLCFTKTKDNIHIGPADNLETFELLRTVGKLEVDIKRDENNNRTVEILGLKLTNIASKTSLMEENRLPLTTAGDKIDKTITAKNTTVTKTYIPAIDPVYLFENHWGKGDVQDAIDGGAPALEIELQLRDDDTPDEGTFTLPLIMDVDEDTKELTYGVARNTLSKMQINVTALTIEVTYTVVDEWDDEYYDREVGKGDSNVNPDGDWDDSEGDYEEFVPNLLKVIYSFTYWDGSVYVSYIEVRKGDIIYIWQHDNQWSNSDIYFEMH